MELCRCLYRLRSEPWTYGIDGSQDQPLNPPSRLSPARTSRVILMRDARARRLVYPPTRANHPSEPGCRRARCRGVVHHGAAGAPAASQATVRRAGNRTLGSRKVLASSAALVGGPADRGQDRLLPSGLRATQEEPAAASSLSPGVPTPPPARPVSTTRAGGKPVQTQPATQHPPPGSRCCPARELLASLCANLWIACAELRRACAQSGESGWISKVAELVARLLPGRTPSITCVRGRTAPLSTGNAAIGRK